MTVKGKQIRIRATIAMFTADYCLLRNVENLTDHHSFKRNHVWIPKKQVQHLELGTIVELTGNLYYYGYAMRQTGLSKIRKVVSV